MGMWVGTKIHTYGLIRKRGVSLMNFLGFGQSFAKWSSPQLKHFVLGLDLFI